MTCSYVRIGGAYVGGNYLLREGQGTATREDFK